MDVAAAAGRSPGWSLAWAWRSMLVLGLAVLAFHYATGVGSGSANHLFDRWIYDAVEILAAVGCLARGAVVRRERWAWRWIGAALLATTCGDILFDTLYNGNPPFPSFADVAYLAFYPAMYVGIGLLLRDRVSRFSASIWLDGLMGAAAAAAVGAAVLVEIVAKSTHGSSLVVMTNLAYPLGDVLLLALVVFVFSVVGWRPGRAWALIAAGLLLVAIGDSIFLLQTATNRYAEGTLLDLAWPGSLSLFALAAWQSPGRVRRGMLERRTLHGTPIACGLAAVGVLVAASASVLVHPIAIALATATVVLVLIRTALTFRENAVLLDLSRSEALTDALTGLANRRKLLSDLADELMFARVDAPRVLALFDLNGFKRYNDTFGHPAGDALLARLAAKLDAAVGADGRAYRMGGDEFCVLVPNSEPLLAQAATALTEQGETFTIASAFGSVEIPREAATVADALKVADARLYRQKNGLATRGFASHEPLLRTLAEREPGLRAHVDDVTTLVLAVGRQMQLGLDELEELELAAQLHDVGKLAIPDAILQKPGPLDEEEWGFIRQHTLVGARILSGAPTLAVVARIVRSTHERWDGAGYPDGLAGEDIPLAARIISVCDAFSAITSDRAYRRASSTEAAVRELQRCAGAQFDASLVEILCTIVEAQLESATDETAALASSA